MPGIVSGVGNLAGAIVKAPFQIVSATGRAVLGSKKTKKGKRVRNVRKSKVVRRRSSSSARRRSGRRSSRRRSSRGRN